MFPIEHEPTLNYTTPLEKSLRRSFPPLGLYKVILDPLHLLIPLINTRKKKDKTLDSPSVLISFSYTRKEMMNSSTRQIGRTRVTVSWAVHKSRIARCSSRVPGFSRSDLYECRKRNTNVRRYTNRKKYGNVKKLLECVKVCELKKAN